MNNRLNLCFIVLSYALAQDPVANLPQGRIVGIKVYAKNSLEPIEIYFGVPYATPPTGRYRFSAPERHPGWRRTFFAHRMPPRCPQFSNGENEYFNEDCLFLNIWTPRPADGNLLPVVVILYSESWTNGGIALPCQELAAEGVVVVTVSYRLHVLAFFTLRSIAARGNLALLDQYLALLWIRENIAIFGGDPAAVTLLGHSAGADSILYHITSPRSLGLFQRAILMSPREVWKTLDENMDFNSSVAERVSREIARSLGCTDNSVQEILHCLRARSLSDIVSLYSNFNWSNSMRPMSDSFLPDSERYLPTTLSAALSATKQPIMQLDLLLGTNDLEAINYNEARFDELMKRSVSEVSEYANTKAIPELLRMFSLQRLEMLPMLVEAVNWEYGGGKVHKNSAREVIDAVEALARAESSAKWGAGSALLAARLARRLSRLYVYRYSQPAGVDLNGKQTNFTGAVHGTDLVTLLGDAMMLQVARRPPTAQETQISLIFRKYVINFIKFGSPDSEEEWQRYRAGNAYVHDICDKDIPRFDAQRATKEIAFWLQYLPNISNLLISSEHTEQLTSEKGDGRLRGGVFALCGVSVALLLLLCVCALLLRRERSHRRRSSFDGDTHR